MPKKPLDHFSIEPMIRLSGDEANGSACGQVRSVMGSLAWLHDTAVPRGVDRKVDVKEQKQSN